MAETDVTSPTGVRKVMRFGANVAGLFRAKRTQGVFSSY
jgi:hypothetical protein